MRWFDEVSIVDHCEVRNLAHLTDAEARRRVNEQIVRFYRHSAEDRTVYAVSIWDGKSWCLDSEGDFCSRTCAEVFGQEVRRRVRAGTLALVTLDPAKGD